MPESQSSAEKDGGKIDVPQAAFDALREPGPGNYKTRGGCHPRCTLGPRRDHPGYLGYRCVGSNGSGLPWPGEDGYDTSVIPPGSGHDS